MLTGDTSCTAAVVASGSGRLAVTAAHCVYVPAVTGRMLDFYAGREPGWAEEIVFIPALSDDDAPHGTWAVDRMLVDRAWQQQATPEMDVAFLQLRDAPSGPHRTSWARSACDSTPRPATPDRWAGRGRW